MGAFSCLGELRKSEAEIKANIYYFSVDVGEVLQIVKYVCAVIIVNFSSSKFALKEQVDLP